MGFHDLKFWKEASIALKFSTWIIFETINMSQVEKTFAAFTASNGSGAGCIANYFLRTGLSTIFE